MGSLAPPCVAASLRTAALVRGTLDKDFGGLSDPELLARLERL